jgi:DNA-binding transcriptional LysR family regulator
LGAHLSYAQVLPPRPLSARPRLATDVPVPYAWCIEFELAQLRSFVTVAEELHFGRAALRLELSQPQVSRHVRSLEGSLGVRLFDRDSRRTTLTDAGRALLPDAQEALAAATRLRERAAQAARGAVGRVAVGFLWSTLRGYLPGLVAAAAERHPEIELSVAQLHYLEIIPSLRRGDVDLTITRRVHEDHEMVARELRQEASLLAVPEAHPLATQTLVDLDALHGLPLIALRRQLVGGAFDAVLSRLRNRGIAPQIVHEARSPTEALALVSAGLGVYQLPANAVTPHAGVVYRPLRDAVSRIVLLRRPEPPAPPVAAIARLAEELFVNTPDAWNDVLGGLETGVVPA